MPPSNKPMEGMSIDIDLEELYRQMDLNMPALSKISLNDGSLNI